MQIKQLINWARKYRKADPSAKEKKEFDSFLDDLAKLGKDPKPFDLEKSKARVWGNLKKKSHNKKSVRHLFPVIRKAAAVFFIFSMLGTLVYHTINIDEEPVLLVKITGEGMRSMVTLVDGSTVRINENSKLEYPEVFTPESRVVYLTGEAFFNVTANANKPFKVVMDSSEITVLGTSFNINTHQNTEVTVASGRVKVSDRISNNNVVLDKGQQALLKASEIQVKKVNPDYYIGWHTRKLEFEEETIASVFSILERAYGVNIELKMPDKEIDCAITGAYSGERIETILLGLRHILDFSYQTDIETKTIFIKVNKCK
ncbi:FecR domain-containing protein [Cyclobacterium sp. 1_MG-2023]|uniref:FecR family protein n=1 Tax=Cyclobacterium sp. 1_MG-2023 TaxID=3062681 RepID=UPI0026E1E126|nr:FecR domain-containing protein [Cyclobacterium sp. 1_MG-2023]MDO6436794.1 FecR domain-containing protein [Cyclobacterium sp. 1_MG-2023]